MPTNIWLGNHAAVDHPLAFDGEGRPVLDANGEHARVRTPIDGKRCTEVELPDGTTIPELVVILTHPDAGIWPHHSDADRPAWVASSDPATAAFLGQLWGVEVREPNPGA